jgi:hypothetical protein
MSTHPAFQDPALPDGDIYVAVSQRGDGQLVPCSPRQDSYILAFLWPVLRGLSTKEYKVYRVETTSHYQEHYPTPKPL